MPDISMCYAHTCPKAPDCYRFRAVPGLRQAYSNFFESDEVCGKFWRIMPHNIVRTAEEATHSAVHIFQL